MNKKQFRQYIKSILLEVKKERVDGNKKEPNVKNYLDSTQSKYTANVDRDHKNSGEKLSQEVERIVKKIDKNATCILDDHNDITASLSGEFKIRISPVGADLFNVEAYRNMTDRVYAISLSKEQVIDFVKVNFSVRKKGYVQSAYDKSMENMKDASEKKSKELPKGEPVKPIEVTDKDVEDAVTDKKDLPNAPMSPVVEPKRQGDHDVEKSKNMAKAQKMSKKVVDDTLVIGKKDFGDTSKIGKKV
jgi:hypothetical protein